MSTPPGEGDSPPSQPPRQPWSWEANTPPPEPTGAGLSWDPPAAAPATSEARDPATGLAEEGGSLPPPPVPTPPAPVDASPPPSEQYPTRFSVDYPDRMSRWKTLLRLVLLIPVWFAGMLVGTLLTFGVLAGFMTVFWRKKYPDWLYRGNAGALGFLARSFAYSTLVTDRFPSFAPEDSPVRLDFDPPPSGDLSRWRVLFWKSLLLIPMQIVLQFLGYALWVVSLLAWFAILFTGNYPRGLFGFSVGVQRWYWRMTSYQVSFNDRYPPYALSANAGPGSNSSVVINGVIGGLIGAGYAAVIVATIVAGNKHQTEQVSYAQLLAGRGQVSNSFDVTGGDGEISVRLNQIYDPGDELIQIIRPGRGERIIVVRWTVTNGSSTHGLVAGDAASLEYRYSGDGESRTKSERAEFIGVSDVSAPANVRSRATAVVQAVFIVPDDAEPLALWFRHGFARGGVKYELR